MYAAVIPRTDADYGELHRRGQSEIYDIVMGAQKTKPLLAARCKSGKSTQETRRSPTDLPTVELHDYSNNMVTGTCTVNRLGQYFIHGPQSLYWKKSPR